jgi:hypothetical protein
MTTWDTFDRDPIATAGITFFDGTTAQGSATQRTNNSQIAQTLEGKKRGSGKFVVEFYCLKLDDPGDPANYKSGVGLVNSWGIAAEAASGGFAGANGSVTPGGDFGWGIYWNTAFGVTSCHIWHGGGTTGVAGTPWGASLGTNAIAMAIDTNNSLLWFNINGTGWFGSSAIGVANPAAGIGGLDISNLLNFNCRVYPCVNFVGNGKFNANFGGGGFIASLPGGFTAGWPNTTAGTYFGTLATSGLNHETTAPLSGSYKSVTKYVAPWSGTLTKVTFPIVNGPAANLTHFKGVIYADSAGSPGALLATSTNTISSGACGEVDFNFAPLNLTGGLAYWFGVDTDGTSTAPMYLLSPTLTGGVEYNAGGYPTPSNPFGGGVTTVNVRYPAIISAPPSGPFNSGYVGKEIIQGCSRGIVTALIDPNTLAVDVLFPFPIIPNDPNNMVVPLDPNTWILQTPIQQVYGLDHLEGKQVMAYADGLVKGPYTVVDGSITLDAAYFEIVVGLAYSAQLQTLALDTGNPTIQGKRKNTPAATFRLNDTRGLRVGTTFNELVEIANQDTISQNPPPLISEDVHKVLPGGWNLYGQVCMEQDYPLPVTVLAVIPEVQVGDTGR